MKLKRISITALLLLVLLSSCNPSEKELASLLQSTLDALPSATPYPTYTQIILPTYTPAPTYTFYPTITKPPTLTPTPKITATQLPNWLQEYQESLIKVLKKNLAYNSEVEELISVSIKNNVIEVRVKTYWVEKYIFPNASYEITKTIAGVLANQPQGKLKLLLGKDEPYKVKLLIYSHFMKDIYRTDTDEETIKSIARCEISFEDWLKKSRDFSED